MHYVHSDMVLHVQIRGADSRTHHSGTRQGRYDFVIHSITTPGLCWSPSPGAWVRSWGSPMVRRSGSRLVKNGQARTANSAQSRWLGGSLEVRLPPGVA
jgi:hypothetical protein